MLRLKSTLFYHNLLNNLFNNRVLMSYLSGIYLIVFLVRGRGAANIEQKEENRQKKYVEK